MKFIFFQIIVISLFFISCGEVINNKNTLKSTLEETYTLVPTQEKVFTMDSESVPLNECVQLAYNMRDGDNVVYYTFYNSYNKSIYFYDFTTTEYLYKIPLEIEGPNGVYPGDLSGYHIVSYDTIYFYSNKTDYLYTLNHQGEVYQTFDYMGRSRNELSNLDIFELRKRRIPPTLSVTSENSIYIIDDNLYLCGSITEEFGEVDSLNHLIITKINTKTNAIDFHAGYPDSYRRGNWGDNYFRYVFWCYNPTLEKFIISFPNDHYIYSYQKDFKDVTRIYAGSMYAGTICSMNFPQGLPPPKEARLAYYFKQYYYRSIIYDPYRNVYYRIIEHPWKDYHKNVDIRLWLKPISIIIYDAEFNFLGEKLLDIEYNFSYSNFILAEDGLYLYKKTDNEDELRYTQFVLTKKWEKNNFRLYHDCLFRWSIM